MTDLPLPLAIPGGRDAALAVELCKERFASLPNGQPSTIDDLLALLVLSCERVPFSGGDPSIIGARVRMFQLGLGSRPPPLSEIEHLGLYALAAFRLGRLTSPSIVSRFRKEGVDPRQVSSALWSRMKKLHAFMEGIREDRARECEALKLELDGVLPEGLSLLPHQLEAVRRAREANWRFIFGDDMGLGKSVMLLSTMALRGEAAFPVFVTAPLSMSETWRQEATKWLAKYDPRCVVLTSQTNVLEEQSKNSDRNNFFIGTYAQLRIHGGLFQRMRLGTFVVDESQNLANPEAVRSQSALLVQSTAGSVLEATGTMLPNGRYAEGYCQMKLVKPDIFSYLSERKGGNDWYDFARHFCDPNVLHLGKIKKGPKKGKAKVRTEYKGRSNDVEFGILLSGIMLRRTKVEVFGDDGLPNKARHLVYVPISSRERMRLQKLRDQIRDTIRHRAVEVREELLSKGVREEVVHERVKKILATETVTELTKMRVELGMAKVSWAVRRVKEMLSEGHDPLVFCWHNPVAAAVSAALCKAGVSNTLATGLMTGRERQDAVELLKARHERVGVLTSAYKEGLTLVGYNRSIMLERWWRPADEQQAEDRIHRFGQERDVAIEYAMIKGTYDEAIGEMAVWKEEGNVQVTGASEVRRYEDKRAESSEEVQGYDWLMESPS